MNEYEKANKIYYGITCACTAAVINLRPECLTVAKRQNIL